MTPLLLSQIMLQPAAAVRVVHKWAYMAKKGFVSLLPKFAYMQLEVGFTIEAQDDAEMPECMLVSTVLSYISDTTGPVIRPEMQK
jgi:hypothetical protein